jgi:hypothetical protein
MAWKKGPLPPETYGWGGVVPADHKGAGFFFADFRGDSVSISHAGRLLRPNEVAWYDNCLTLPPEKGEPHV